jgi:hypothetical protein
MAHGPVAAADWTSRFPGRACIALERTELVIMMGLLDGYIVTTTWYQSKVDPQS